MHAAVSVRNRYRIVVCNIIGTRKVLRQRNRVLALPAFDVGNLSKLRPASSAVGAAAENDVDRVPVAALAFACFRVGEKAALPGDDDSRDPVKSVSALTGSVDVHFFD